MPTGNIGGNGHDGDRDVILGEVAGGRDNNFNLIRMIAASGVLVSHAFPIALGEGTLQPFEATTGYTLGWICVAVFFAISGFLIARSFDRTSRVENWFSARVMRLFPGLIVVTVLTVLVYGPALTTLSMGEYWRSAATWTYVPRNVTLVSLQYPLPGVIADNPHPGAINGSLWTLVHEVACYGGVFLAGMIGGLRSKRFFGVLFLGYIAAYVASGIPGIAEHLPTKIAAFRKLTYPFAIGMALYVWRDHIRLSWLVAICLAGAAALALAFANLAFEPLFVLAIAYATFVLAYRPGGVVRRYNDLGDYSYGMYVYAFPVQQAAVAVAGPMSPTMNMLVAFPVTLILAAISWYLVEKPALDRRGHLASLLGRFRRGSPPAQPAA